MGAVICLLIYTNKKAKSHRVHVLIAHEWIENPSGKLCVDHIDGNKQNNCIENLRWATISENQGNRIKQHNPSSSIYKGVSFHKRAKKWTAYTKFNNKMENVGVFENEKEATTKYNFAALEHFGEFAKLNEIED